MADFVKIRDLVKQFGRIVAVNGLNVDIQEGEFFTLLGPSGCGKTTTLRCIAGLEEPEAGEVYMGERCLVSAAQGVFVQPEKREMGMVFQSYAIWPHMTVFENVSYPLKLRRMRRPDIREKVTAALKLVGLEGLEERPAPALSGGQQQRVALARALVFSPRVLLLDEPLSNLDARLRDEMRVELKALQRRLGVTVIFVTHDQIEALSLSDRIALMNRGQLEQVGNPEQVYNKPSTPFARDFLGKTFSLLGKVVSVKDHLVQVELSGVADSLWVSVSSASSSGAGVSSAGQEIIVAVRPEQIGVWSTKPDNKLNILSAAVQSVHFLGDRYEYTVSLGSETRLLVLPASQVLKAGERIFLELKPEGITLWPRAT
jgi:iron(III) transport system ATP-binding protein